jgi:hypothetical protein
MANETPRDVNGLAVNGLAVNGLAVKGLAVNGLERQRHYAREPRHAHWQPGGVRQPCNLADPGRLAKEHREALESVREE